MKTYFIIILVGYVNFNLFKFSVGNLNSIFLFGKMIPSYRVSNLFNQLQDCHLQLFWPLQENSFKVALHKVLSYLSTNNFVVSTKRISNQNKSNATFRYNTLKGINCLSHIFLQFKQNTVIPTEKSVAYAKYVIFFKNLKQDDSDITELINSLSSSVTKSHYIQVLPIIIYMYSAAYIVRPISSLNSSLEPQVLNLSTEFKLHYQQKLNMNLKIVDSPLRKDTLFQNLSSCNYTLFIMPSFKNIRHFADKCIIIEMARKLNFSYDNRNGRRVQNVINPIPMEETNFRISSGNHKLQVVEYGFSFEPWAYLVVKEKPNSFDAAIAGAFDVLIWSILLFLNISLRVHQKVLSLLKLQNKNKLYKLARVLWALSMSTIISQAYKGRLTGFITKPPIPDFPIDFDTLVEQNLTTITYSGKLGSGKVQWVSSLKLYLKNGKRHTKYLNRYLDFTNAIKQKRGWPDGMFNLTARIFALENKFFSSKRKTNWFRYPRTVAVLEPLHHITQQKYLLNVFAPTKWISPPITVNKFTAIKFWMVDKSYFYPLFKRLFVKFQENGLKQLWQRYSRGIAELNGLYSVLPRLKMLGANVDGNLNISVKVGNWKKYYFAGAISGVHYAKIFDGSKLSAALSMESLHVIWCLFAILIGGNLILLAVEVVRSKL